MKYYKNPKDCKTLIIEEFKKQGKLLFDIRQCKMPPLECQCEYCHLLPHKVKEFIIDQLGPRMQTIPRIIPRTISPSSTIDQPSTSATRDNASEIVSSVTSLLSDITLISKEETESNISIEDMPIPNIAKTCIHYNISPEVAAALVNATLIDYGIYNEQIAMTESKIRRAIEIEHMNILAKKIIKKLFE